MSNSTHALPPPLRTLREPPAMDKMDRHSLA